MPAFALQFPPREIRALATRFGPSDETRFLATGAAARARGHYTRDEFIEVCAWKTVRSRPKVAANREAVVDQDPANDFARTSLARGYDRLGNAHRFLHNVTAALDYTDRALRIYRGRMDAHPERDFTWREYATALFSDIRTDAQWLATCPVAERPRLRAQSSVRDRIEKARASRS
jgi:hypothetical protein